MSLEPDTPETNDADAFSGLQIRGVHNRTDPRHNATTKERGMFERNSLVDLHQRFHGHHGVFRETRDTGMVVNAHAILVQPRCPIAEYGRCI